MEKTNYVIKNLPIRLPFQSTVLYSFLLWYFKVDNFIWGIFVFFYALLWSLAIYTKCNEVSIDINKEETDTGKKKAKSRFAEKMAEIIAKNANK